MVGQLEMQTAGDSHEKLQEPGQIQVKYDLLISNVLVWRPVAESLKSNGYLGDSDGIALVTIGDPYRAGAFAPFIMDGGRDSQPDLPFLTRGWMDAMLAEPWSSEAQTVVLTDQWVTGNPEPNWTPFPWI